MATIHTKYLGELRTEAIHLKSAQRIITDAPVDNQGKGQAFSPSDLLCASLGSCMLTIMGIAARTHRINMDGTELSITKVMAENPRRVAEIVLDFELPDELDEKQKAILEHAAHTCPVALSLHPDIKQKTAFLYGKAVAN